MHTYYDISYFIFNLRITRLLPQKTLKVVLESPKGKLNRCFEFCSYTVFMVKFMILLFKRNLEFLFVI